MKLQELKKSLIEILKENKLIKGENIVFDEQGIFDNEGNFLNWTILSEFETPLEPPSKEYFGFEANETGLGIIDRIIKNPLYHFFARKQEAEILELTPLDFLIGTAPTITIYEMESHMDKQKIKEYAEKMKSGIKFPTLVLYYFENSVEHEGRHRAFAAKSLEIKAIPVLVLKEKKNSLSTNKKINQT